MRKGIGIFCLVVGVIMIMMGYQTEKSIKGRVYGIIGSPSDNKITWLYIGGAVLCAAGVFQIYLGKK